METVSIEMLPQICPHHPDTRVVETKTDTSGLEKEGDVILTQYKCAAGARCGQPLGWQFRHKTKEVYRYGPGRCDDPRMKQALLTTRYHTTTFVACLVGRGNCRAPHNLPDNGSIRQHHPDFHNGRRSDDHSRHHRNSRNSVRHLAV